MKAAAVLGLLLVLLSASHISGFDDRGRGRGFDDDFFDDGGFFFQPPRRVLPIIAPEQVNVSSVYAALASPNFSTLKAAVDALGLARTLNNTAFTGTVFAPTNQAFNSLLPKFGATPAQLLANRDLLRAVVLAHVVPGVVAPAAFLRTGSQLFTLNRNSVLTAIVRSSGVSIVSKGSTATVTTANLFAPRAVIHVIDTVLVPDTSFYPGCRTVASIAGSAGLTSLAAALNATGLLDVVADPGFAGTVLAPDNNAFAGLLGALNVTLDRLAGNRGLLTTVLLYHILPYRLYASNFVNGGVESTLARGGFPVRTVKSGSTLTIRGFASNATVTVADNIACAANVHVINNVLLPITPAQALSILSGARPAAPRAVFNTFGVAQGSGFTVSGTVSSGSDDSSVPGGFISTSTTSNDDGTVNTINVGGPTTFSTFVDGNGGFASAGQGFGFTQGFGNFGPQF